MCRLCYSFIGCAPYPNNLETYLDRSAMDRRQFRLVRCSGADWLRPAKKIEFSPVRLFSVGELEDKICEKSWYGLCIRPKVYYNGTRLRRDQFFEDLPNAQNHWRRPKGWFTFVLEEVPARPAEKQD